MRRITRTRIVAVTPALLTLLLLGRGVSLEAQDCNANGQIDSRDIEGGVSADCDADAVPDECQFAPIQFGLREQGFPVESFPVDLAVHDLNGDGRLDIVSVNRDSTTESTISILLGDGEGTLHVDGTYDVDSRASSVAVADLDDDGDPDLVTANRSTISFILNDGRGTFGEATSFEVENGTRFIRTADVNDDGLVDLLATNTITNTVCVFFNLGNATFDAPACQVTGDYANAVVAADLDGDGDLDLTVSNRDEHTISILDGDGSGAFGPPRRIPTGANRPFALEAVDMDSDGDLDVAFGAQNGVGVLLNDGTGNFPESNLFGMNPLSFVTADADGDGDRDIVAGVSLGRGHKARVVVNDGQARFRSFIDFSVDGPVRAVAGGDLDDDGDTDLAITPGNPAVVAVLWNREGISISLETATMAARPHSATMADLDGDGRPDVATGDGNGRTVTLFLNDGAGGLSVSSTANGAGYLNSITNGDFDGDGDIDLAVGALRENGVGVLLNPGNGRFPAARTFGIVGSGPFFVGNGDIDGDGNVDLFTANESSNNVSILFGEGDGTFLRRASVRADLRPTAVAAVDVNGDGALDLAVSNHRASRLTVHLNAGDGSFEAQALGFPVSGRPIYVTAGDFDGDGHGDVATCNDSTRELSVWYNDGDGSLEPDAVNLPLGQTPYSVITADIDGDGSLDFVVADETPNKVSVVLNDGGRRYRAPFHVTVGDDPRFVMAGDLDGDGDTDIVSSNHTSRDLTVLYNQAPAVAAEDYLESICTEAAYHRLSVSLSDAGATDRSLRYVAPVDAGNPELLPVLFQNNRRYALHEEFLSQVFPDRFPDVSAGVYRQLVGRRATRQYYVGSILRLHTAEGLRYGFFAFADLDSSLDELLTLDEVRSLWETLSAAFTLAPLVYVPQTREDKEEAVTWQNPGFDILIDDGAGLPPFVPYTQAVGYGTLRILSREEFLTANETGRVSFQEIFVLEHAPRDIEGVIGGVVTAEPQGPLSHLAVRTARRRTPNAFVRDALEAFARFEGRLVRLEVRDAEYRVIVADREEAEAFWETNRPQLELPSLDPEYSLLDSLEDMELTGEVPPEARYGGKATNLARLQRLLTGQWEQYSEVGFAIPMRYYLDFMRTNLIPSALDPGRLVSYERYVLELLDDEEFQNDSEFRFNALATLRDYGEDNGIVAPQVVRSVALKAVDVFGSSTMRLRCRSSSNAEDSLEFNGAGLYISLSACPGDDLDIDSQGPSRCDPEETRERGFARALRRVWLSLWNFRAFEEREFYGIPQDRIAMGILVSRAFRDERANGVAFTGDPADPADPRYMVAAQIGENSVVSPELGVLAEIDRLEIEDSQVVGITRSQRSTLVPRGTVVLSDEELEELGALMAHLDASFPVDLDDHEPEEVLLDVEFKIEANGDLSLKQIRPFLNTAPKPPAPEFALSIPAGTTACGVFNTDREDEPLREYLAKSTVLLRSGRHSLPTEASVFEYDLIEEVRFGPDLSVAVPQAPGTFVVNRFAQGDGITEYDFHYEQDFRLEDGRDYRIRMGILGYEGRGDLPLVGAKVLDEEFLTNMRRVDQDPLQEPSSITGIVEGQDDVVIFASCRYAALPLFEIAADLSGGDSLRFEERFLEPERLVDTGPASLVGASLVIGGVARRVDEYQNLVYSAFRHNSNAQYWAVLEPSIAVEGIGSVRVVEVLSADPEEGRPRAVVHYLGESFEILASPEVLTYDKTEVGETPFRRGDVDSDGDVLLTDAVALLAHLFRGGAPPACAKAADANDDGQINLSDGVSILNHLFRGAGPLAPPFEGCGVDPSADTLECAAFSGCG